MLKIYLCLLSMLSFLQVCLKNDIRCPYVAVTLLRLLLNKIRSPVFADNNQL